MSIFHIKTGKRTYNCVKSAFDFRSTRFVMKDKTKVQSVHKWNRKNQKWVKSNKKPFEFKK